ncbi:CTB family bacteriocin [Nostoc sp.]|uniref:CTB family bacteriocin n=1 Tax=Nostoc sp. TaxID=1180 RepID=UPI002FF6334A
MSHELFTDLSAEQQEVVAGGLAAISFDTQYLNLSTKSVTIFPVGSMSGLGGSNILAGGLQKTNLDIIQSSSSFKAIVD